MSLLIGQAGKVKLARHTNSGIRDCHNFVVSSLDRFGFNKFVIIRSAAVAKVVRWPA